MAYADEPSLGTALRRLRLARNLSMDETARRSGASKAALSAWETGSRRPRGPALVRLLDALGTDERTKARLLHLADPQQARIALADSSLGPPVGVGGVLRAMRGRRGVAQADLARRLGVSQAAVSRWELGEAVPPPETIHALGFALGATVEETLALASADGNGAGGLPEDRDAALAQACWGMAAHALLEIVFLGWEAELSRRAAWDARWDTHLAIILARRSRWLIEEERYGEILHLARRAIPLVRTPEARLHSVPMVAALADADRRLGRGHAEAAELAGEWAAQLPPSQHRAWMLRQRGLSLVRMGRVSEGTSLVAQSAEVELDTGLLSGEPWAYRATTVGEAHLEAGEARRAAALLEGPPDRGHDWPTYVRIAHAVGRAATPAEMAYLRHWMATETPSPLKRRRLEALERRQAWLTGEPPAPEEPVPDDPRAEGRLWAAVLREGGQ